MALASVCLGTHFWLFQYTFLVVTVLILGVTVLVSACFWLLNYSVLVVTVGVSGCNGTFCGCYGTSTVTTRNKYCNNLK
jgi:hypothetical protein